MKHWFLAGSHPGDYLTGVDDTITHDGKKAAYLRSSPDQPSGFGTLMQTFNANRYRNKRMRFAAAVKSEGLSEWAGLWMRVDGKGTGETLSFDNMQGRAIKGTTDWERYQVVLDVPEKATTVNFGTLLDGKGQIWLSGVQFEEAPDEPTTDINSRADEPGNLDFSED